MKKDLKGILPYIVSPVDSAGRVKTESLNNLVEYLIKSKVHGITPLGSTGEFFYLTDEQKKTIVEAVIKQVDGRVPVVPGVAASNTIQAVNQARYYESLGADGVVAVLNTYFPVTQEAAYDYFSNIAKSISIPVVLYNNPRFTHFDMKADLVSKLSEIENIMYYKDASGVTGNLMPIFNGCRDRIKIFSASAHLPVTIMMLGGCGWMSGPACLIPKSCVELYNLCEARKWEEATILQNKIWNVNSIFQKYNLAAAIKAGLNIKGFDVGDPIPPNARISKAGYCEIESVISQLE